MVKKYVVRLSDEERQNLQEIVTTGKRAAALINHARILLKADCQQSPGWRDQDIKEALDISLRTIERVRKRFVEEGLEAALSPRPHPRRPRKLDGTTEAHLVALCCSEPPAGQGRWTLRLLAQQMVELDYVDDISHESVRPTAKKNELQPWRQSCWVIPPSQSAEFVWHMEAVLTVYQTDYTPNMPVICIDEASKQLVKETRLPIPAQPGQPERVDYEYERNGTANLFMVCEPMIGWRRVTVTERRTAVDYAHLLKTLVDIDYAQAQKIIVIQDNLNTHSPASLYKAFEPAEAQRILSRLEFCHTPKHGSWLNMAEIELSVLSRQCLSRRIPDQETLKREVDAWQDERNHQETWIDWRFTTADARLKLQHLYPSIDC
ncbi:IS630 family transposase [Spirulina major]|uniref:IS630 family transposase n=1 Tax=Spirulina major TaxID=270636 RepID=UPI001114A059|nr:IS630 family transposase [Spirulina major]